MSAEESVKRRQWCSQEEAIDYVHDNDCGSLPEDLSNFYYS